MKKYLGFIIIFILGFLPLIPLFFPGLPKTHDGQDHVARIANFYLSLTEGNIIPRWAGNLNWGYGHPILMFLYPFPSYSASFFHFLGFSFIDSVKMVFGVSYILSGIGMYLWIRNAFGEKAGIVAGTVYMYAPYRLVDLYVRGAIGEHVAFLFAPFICYFLFKLSKKYSYVYFSGLSLSIAGLLLSHNAIALMLLPIIILYSLTLVTKKNSKFPIISLFAFFIGIGLSCFFLFPAFFEGKYTLRDKVTGNFEYKNSFVPFQKFFDMSWSFGGSTLLSKQLGIPIILSFLLALYFAFIKKGKTAIAFFIFGGSILFSVFLMTQFSDFLWQNITLIQKFQFPWRFLAVIVFSGSALSGICVYAVKKESLKNILMGILILSSILFSISYIKVNDYLQKPESFFTGIYYGTTDTGESAPIWSVRFMEKVAKLPVEIIEGQATISNYNKKSTLRTYKIEATSPARIRENTLYFPGWEVFVNNEKVNIEYQDELNRGLITYFVPRGESQVKVVFRDTKMRTFATIITGASILILIGIGFRSIFRKKI